MFKVTVYALLTEAAGDVHSGIAAGLYDGVDIVDLTSTRLKINVRRIHKSNAETVRLNRYQMQ